MTALADNYARRRHGVDPVLALAFAMGVAASTTIYKGSLVALNYSGYLVPASADPSLRVVGVAEDEIDNSTGSNGDETCAPRRGCFYFTNSATTAAVSDADIGRLCYAVDDNTVARHDALGTRPVAGRVMGVDSFGVLVEVGLSPANADGSVDIMLLAGADLSLLRHYPVKLNGSGAAVAATTAGEAILGILQNAPANGAIAIVRVSGISSIVLGDTITQGMKLAVEATSGRAKEAVAAYTNTSDAGAAQDALVGSYVFGICITGGADGETGLCLLSPMGAIPTTAA